MQYCWCSIIFFSFPSFPEFHRVVPLLETCSTSEFVYDRACFVYMFIFAYIFHIWEKICTLCIPEPGLLHLTWYLPLHLFTFKSHVIIPYGWIILNYIYVPHFLDPFISCRAHGLFPKLGNCE
jgi:hypothetical protein